MNEWTLYKNYLGWNIFIKIENDEYFYEVRKEGSNIGDYMSNHSYTNIAMALENAKELIETIDEMKILFSS